jgi:hypothetical protein
MYDKRQLFNQTSPSDDEVALLLVDNVSNTFHSFELIEGDSEMLGEKSIPVPYQEKRRHCDPLESHRPSEV